MADVESADVAEERQDGREAGESAKPVYSG